MNPRMSRSLIRRTFLAKVWRCTATATNIMMSFNVHTKISQSWIHTKANSNSNSCLYMNTFNFLNNVENLYHAIKHLVTKASSGLQDMQHLFAAKSSPFQKKLAAETANASFIDSWHKIFSKICCESGTVKVRFRESSIIHSSWTYSPSPAIGKLSQIRLTSEGSFKSTCQLLGYTLHKRCPGITYGETFR